jgi:hypothetical protein
MLRTTIAAGLLVSCAGCLETNGAWSGGTQPNKADASIIVGLAPTIPKETAIEVARAAICEREAWARGGFPNGAAIDALGDPDGWTIKVFPPIDTPGEWDHLSIYVDNQGKVKLYTESW